MTGQEWEELANLIALVHKGASDVCEFIDVHMKREIEDRLSRAGVPNHVEDACQDVLVNVRRNMCQLEEVDFFEPWLARIVMSAAKKYRPRMVRHSKPLRKKRSQPEKRSDIGSKTITIDGTMHAVRIFEANPPHDQVVLRTRLFEPLSDLVTGGKSNPDCFKKIDVFSAMAQLPRRWAEALRLRIVEQYTAAEAAEILNCTIPRVYRLVQLAKARMRQLMPGYGQSEAPASNVGTRRVKHTSPLALEPISTPTLADLGFEPDTFSGCDQTMGESERGQ